MKRLDLSGKTFNHLTVLSFDCVKNGNTYFICQCKCGTIVKIASRHLKNNATKSCGCLNKKIVKELFSTHCLSKSREYKVYYKMINRCYNKNDNSYANYGGRGIKVSKNWLDSFMCFYNDMGKVPSKSFSIERINNNGNYTKENCIWADKKTQSRNRRSCRIVLNTENGIYYNTIVEAAESINMKMNTLRNNLFYQKNNKTKFIII